MHIVHNVIWIPKIAEKKIEDNISKFEVGPLPRGYGITLWNSMRRVLLSSLPWTKVTGIKVSWVSHEYSTLPWIKDGIVDVMLNLKELIIEKNDTWIEWLKLNKSKAGVVTAADIQTPAGVKILNKDMYITEIDKNWLELDIEIRVEKNVGYLSIEELREKEDDVNVLLLDANFSPITNVKYSVESTRIEDMTNLENLEIEVSTSWVISPAEAIKFSGDMLTSYFGLFNEDWLQVDGNFISDVADLLNREKEEVKEELEKETYTPIEIMGLSPRTLNALINGDILSIEALTKCTETKLVWIKGFGKKAMTEIRSSLAERGYKLLWDD